MNRVQFNYYSSTFNYFTNEMDGAFAASVFLESPSPLSALFEFWLSSVASTVVGVFSVVVVGSTISPIAMRVAFFRGGELLLLLSLSYSLSLSLLSLLGRVASTKGGEGEFLWDLVLLLLLLLLLLGFVFSCGWEAALALCFLCPVHIYI